MIISLSLSVCARVFLLPLSIETNDKTSSSKLKMLLRGHEIECLLDMCLELMCVYIRADDMISFLELIILKASTCYLRTSS